MSGAPTLPEEIWNAMTQDERWDYLRSEGRRTSAKVEARKARVAAGEQPFVDPRRAASVALLRAMDREPRSCLIELLRAYHAGAEREELGELLREAFGASTAAKVAPGKWAMLRDRFAGYLYVGPEAERVPLDGEVHSLKSLFASPEDGWNATAAVAMFAHAMSALCGEP